MNRKMQITTHSIHVDMSQSESRMLLRYVRPDEAQIQNCDKVYPSEKSSVYHVRSMHDWTPTACKEPGPRCTNQVSVLHSSLTRGLVSLALQSSLTLHSSFTLYSSLTRTCVSLVLHLPSSMPRRTERNTGLEHIFDMYRFYTSYLAGEAAHNPNLSNRGR